MAIKTYITTRGSNLLAKALSRGFAINFTKCELGTGTAGTEQQILAYNSLVNKFDDAVMGGRNYEGNATCKFSVQYTTSSLTTTVLIKEIGIYASDPDDGTILFGYTTFGTDADRLFPNSEAAIYRVYDVTVSFSAANGVSVTIDPTALVKSSQVARTATANKLLLLNDNAKLPASITGDADTLDGKHSSDFANASHNHANATTTNAGFESAEDKANIEQLKSRVNQAVNTNSTPTFNGINVNGFINGAAFL